MNISVVILTYNTKDITDICIEKAIAAGKFAFKKAHVNTEIVVVDNASTDGTLTYLKPKYPKVKFIRNKTNLGVSAGYNIGMRSVKNADYILILNSDLYLEEDAIFNSYTYIQKNKKCDVLICKLFNSKNKFEGYGGHLPTPIKTILWLLGFESIPILKNFVNRIYLYNKDFYKRDFQMEWAPSCFYFLKYKVFESTRGHDERIFIYMDDVEWCKRIKDAGFKLFYTPSFTSVHLCGASTVNKGIDSWRLQQQVAGIKYYQKKHHKNTAWLVNIVLGFGLTLRSILYLFKGDRETSRNYLHSIAASF